MDKTLQQLRQIQIQTQVRGKLSDLGIVIEQLRNKLADQKRDVLTTLFMEENLLIDLIRDLTTLINGQKAKEHGETRNLASHFILGLELIRTDAEERLARNRQTSLDIRRSERLSALTGTVQ